MPQVNLKALVKSGAIVPYVVISCLGLAVVSMLTYTIGHAVANHGLMPPPSALEAYTCQGAAQPLVLDFEHGKDIVKLHYQSETLDGAILNGKIEWAGGAQASQRWNLALPAEVVYDDLKSLRVLDTRKTELLCTRPVSPS